MEIVKAKDFNILEPGLFGLHRDSSPPDRRYSPDRINASYHARNAGSRTRKTPSYKAIRYCHRFFLAPEVEIYLAGERRINCVRPRQARVTILRKVDDQNRRNFEPNELLIARPQIVWAIRGLRPLSAHPDRPEDLSHLRVRGRTGWEQYLFALLSDRLPRAIEACLSWSSR